MEFHKNRAKKDGLATECRDCKKENDRVSHSRNRNKRLKMMQEYQEENRKVLRIKSIEYSRSEKGRERNNIATKRYYSEHKDIIAERMKALRLRKPQEYKARYQFSNVIKLGHIIRPSHCQMCFKEGLVHGHHADYSKPFDVVWVCTKCHGILHRKEHANV